MSAIVTDPTPERLSRNPDFAKLWFGQTISLFGSAVTMLALPSVAILTLGAKTYQVGLLEATQFLAFPLLGMPAGVWVDRLSRRTVMIVADFGRAGLLAYVPLAWALHALRLWHLYVVALAIGVLTVFFDVAYQSYLPSLVQRSAVLEGNAKLEISRSASEVAGHGLGGVLVQVLGAPLAMLADALSYLASVFSLALIRKREPAVQPRAQSENFWSDLRQGAQVVFGNPVLRSIAASTATSNLGTSLLSAVFLIFAYRRLHLAPALVGLILAFGNAGLFGAFFSARIAHRFGLGKTLAAAMVLGGTGILFAPLAALGAPVLFLVASQLLFSFSIPLYNVNQVSLRQTIVSDALQGRVNATMRTIAWGTLPLGGAIGGLLGGAIGVVPTIIIAGLISLCAALWIWLGDVYRLVSIPAETIATHNVAEGAEP